MFACVASLQAVFGFLSPLYNKLYAATIGWNVHIQGLGQLKGVGAIYLVSSGFYILMIIIALYCLIFLRRQEKKVPSEEITQL